MTQDNSIVIREYLTTDKEVVMNLIKLNTPNFFAKEEVNDLSNYLDKEIELYYVLLVDGKVVGCGGINFAEKRTIEYFGYLRGVNKKELDSNVEQVLRDVNLYENRNDKVKSFSGGMKQRLGIAITCVANPEIIIFDEPTVGLDPEERARFKNLIRKLSKTKTIVLSTHILSDVEEVADYIILIKEGCLTKFEKIGGKDNE